MNAPTKFYGVRRDTGAEVFIGDYINTTRGTEITLTVSSPFVVDRIIARGQNINAGQEGVGLCWGSEWKIIGDYKPLADPTVNRPRQPLGNLLGANGGPWDLTTGGVAVNDASVSRMVQMGFSHFRHYWHARRVYKSDTDTHAWQRTMAVADDAGGWPLAMADDAATAAGITNIWSLIQVTDEIGAEWGTIVNVPFVNYAQKDNRESPSVHWRPARMAYVIAKREGRDSSAPDSLMGTQYVHPTYGSNTIEKGRNKNIVLEIGNEKDVTYGDVYAYENGKRMGAYLSAIYDGHKNTIDVGFGAGVGVGIQECRRFNEDRYFWFLA
jgi:endoglucanase